MKIKIDKRVVKSVFTEFYGYFVIFLLMVLGYFLSKIPVYDFITFLYDTLGTIPFWTLIGIINILTIFFGYKFLSKKQDKVLFLVLLAIAIILDLGLIGGIIAAAG